jgi:hypothetical protein
VRADKLARSAVDEYVRRSRTWHHRRVTEGSKLGRYECAFCGLDTDDDPRYAWIDLSWEHTVATQRLGAHMACLEAAVRPGFPLLDGLE